MRTGCHGLRALVALVVLTLPLAAIGGEESERSSVRIEVHVTSLTTGEVYLDAGREQGLEPGDRVRLSPLGGAWVDAVILSVTSGSARARLEGEGKGLDVGTPGEVRVPSARLEPDDRGESVTSAPTSSPARSAASAGAQGPIVPAPQAGASAPAEQEQAQPERPDWSAPPEEWSQQMPLLAPAQAREDPERAVTWRGYAFVDGQATFDQDRDYSLARTGVDLEVGNLLGHNGVLEVDVEAFARRATVFSGSDDDESRARIDRLSYLWGGDRERPTSLQGGRFMQRMIPAFGVLDGLEGTHRFASGDSIGASVGFLPEWTPEMETGDDLQVAAAWRHLAGASDQLELGLGLQKTWHDGEADRDLAVGTLDWRPDPTWNVHATAWVDFYGSDEVVKSSGAELTQATFHVAKRFAGSGGLTLFGTHMLYPDLLRNEYRPVEPTELDDFENSRLGASAWREIARKVRLTARVSVWADDEDDGLTGQLRLGVRDRIVSQGELALALFGGDGKYSRVMGARISASRSLARGWWTLGLESALHEQDGFIGEQAELWQHVLRGSYDTELGQDWDVSLWGDQRFGDEQQATTVGFSLRRRF